MLSYCIIIKLYIFSLEISSNILGLLDSKYLTKLSGDNADFLYQLMIVILSSSLGSRDLKECSPIKFTDEISIFRVSEAPSIGWTSVLLGSLEEITNKKIITIITKIKP